MKITIKEAIGKPPYLAPALSMFRVELESGLLANSVNPSVTTPSINDYSDDGETIIDGDIF